MNAPTPHQERGADQTSPDHRVVIIELEGDDLDDRVCVHLDTTAATATIEAGSPEMTSLTMVGCDVTTGWGASSTITRFSDRPDGVSGTELVVAATWSFRPGSDIPDVTGRGIVLRRDEMTTYAVTGPARPDNEMRTAPDATAGPPSSAWRSRRASDLRAIAFRAYGRLSAAAKQAQLRSRATHALRRSRRR